MTRLGDFRKFLATNFTKLAEIFCDVWAIFENITQLKSKKKLFWLLFEQLLEEFGLHLIPGHTGLR